MNASDLLWYPQARGSVFQPARPPLAVAVPNNSYIPPALTVYAVHPERLTFTTQLTDCGCLNPVRDYQQLKCIARALHRL